MNDMDCGPRSRRPKNAPHGLPEFAQGYLFVDFVPRGDGVEPDAVAFPISAHCSSVLAAKRHRGMQPEQCRHLTVAGLLALFINRSFSESRARFVAVGDFVTQTSVQARVRKAFR